MDFWTLIAIAFIMGIVTGLVGFLGFQARRRQGATKERDSTMEALDLRGLPHKEANQLRLLHKTMTERLPYVRQETARKMFKRKIWD